MLNHFKKDSEKNIDYNEGVINQWDIDDNVDFEWI